MSDLNFLRSKMHETEKDLSYAMDNFATIGEIRDLQRRAGAARKAYVSARSVEQRSAEYQASAFVFNETRI
jgi:hypothetical protein